MFKKTIFCLSILSMSSASLIHGARMPESSTRLLSLRGYVNIKQKGITYCHPMLQEAFSPEERTERFQNYGLQPYLISNEDLLSEISSYPAVKPAAVADIFQFNPMLLNRELQRLAKESPHDHRLLEKITAIYQFMGNEFIAETNYYGVLAFEERSKIYGHPDFVLPLDAFNSQAHKDFRAKKSTQPAPEQLTYELLSPSSSLSSSSRRQEAYGFRPIFVHSTPPPVSDETHVSYAASPTLGARLYDATYGKQ